MPPDILATPDGNIGLHPLSGGRTRVLLEPRDPNAYIARRSCETSLPTEIVELLLHNGSYAWICDAIARFEEPDYVAGVLRRQLFAYFSAADFAGKSLLDFGCGYGASSMALASMLPSTLVTGIELDPRRLEVAQAVAAYRKIPNVRFLLSPSGDRLPPGIGVFDFIMLSAVYEHLLPHERAVLMPQLWQSLADRGALFINATPHRYAPFEHHSTELWLINYLPDRAAHWFARHCAGGDPKINRSADWSVLLRGGVRGGAERRMIAELTRNPGEAVILQPRQCGLKDRADYWLSRTGSRYRLIKRCLAAAFRLTDKLFDTIPALNVDVVIGKGHPPGQPASSKPQSCLCANS